MWLTATSSLPTNESTGVTSTGGISYIISPERLKVVSPTPREGERLERGTTQLSGFTAGSTLLRLRDCVRLLSGTLLKVLGIRRDRDDERRDPHFLKRYRWSDAASFW